MNSTVLQSFQFDELPRLRCGLNVAGMQSRPGYVDGRKLEIALSEKIALLLHRHVDVPYSLVVT